MRDVQKWMDNNAEKEREEIAEIARESIAHRKY